MVCPYFACLVMMNIYSKLIYMMARALSVCNAEHLHLSVRIHGMKVYMWLLYMWLSAIVPYIWLSAIMPLVSYRFWKPHCTGEVLLKFSIDTILFLFLQEKEGEKEAEKTPLEPSRSTPAPLALAGEEVNPNRLPHRCRSTCTASPRHCTDLPWPR
jgi:hypothetical protein